MQFRALHSFFFLGSALHRFISSSPCVGTGPTASPPRGLCFALLPPSLPPHQSPRRRRPLRAARGVSPGRRPYGQLGVRRLDELLANRLLGRRPAPPRSPPHYCSWSSPRLLLGLPLRRRCYPCPPNQGRVGGRGPLAALGAAISRRGPWRARRDFRYGQRELAWRAWEGLSPSPRRPLLHILPLPPSPEADSLRLARWSEPRSHRRGQRRSRIGRLRHHLLSLRRP